MATADDVLRVARGQLGVREARDGSNPYGNAYGADRVAWCAQYLWWCFRQVGADGLLGGKTAYTPTLADQFRRGRAFSNLPRVGDIAFFNWPDSINRIQHVGLVEAVEPGAVVTLEGNTSSANQSDGGGVMRRRRARNTSIVGYGHPAYTAAKPAPTPRPATAQEDDMFTDDDRRVQREIHAKLHGAHRTRVNFALLGEPASDFHDDIGGFAIGGDARAYEARQLALQIRRDVTELLALAKAQPAPTQLDAVEVDGPALLTADDVRQILREALADLGPLHLTAKEATPS